MTRAAPKATPAAAAPHSAPSLSAPALQEGGFAGHIVCIGASAGGLDALEKFFKACPVDIGAAIVVIQHLSPDHKSMMNNLLARHTPMPITVVEDDMALEVNHVYLIPPGSVMRISQPGHLQLTPKTTRGLTLPIDIFFTSLAEHFGKKAVGIILSGTGSDGTRGVVAINAGGGFLMVQDPESAKFDGMPRSAIATGMVDAILPAEELPGRLLAHVRNLPLPKPVAARRVPHAQMPASEVLLAILKLLHQVSGIDFNDYKQATVMRRIERRMQVRHTPELYQYLDLLESDPLEVATLRREMLISVTSFFRDRETFDVLAERVIGPMVEALPPDANVRVWSAGVASGEEPYTLAMLFIEAFDKHRRWPNLKVFATDVDQGCIEAGGAGQYPESAAAELSPERLERFFVKRGDKFVVKNELRQCIVFARHNLLTDPPFTRMDLVSCRNTLIYFRSGPQERALRALQYAVKEGGALLLGSSESLWSATDGMQTVSAKHKIFKRIGPTTMPLLDRKGDGFQPPLQSSRGRVRSNHAGNIADLGLAMLMGRYVPPAVIVNDRREIVHFFGDVSRYLQPREGAASLELNRQLPDALVPVASALLFKAERERVHLAADPVEIVTRGGELVVVRLASFPIETKGDERCTLLCFETDTVRIPPSLPVEIDVETIARVGTLERELMATRENLQATIEELETSNEELQATNEELMASNEELQSSNEELQSLNEEMNTVNAEFQEKMQILNRANADLDGMSRAVGVATIFVDDAMNITRFSSEAMQIFKLREIDIGRRLDEIAHNLNYTGLIDDVATTLATGRLSERQLQTGDGGRTYLTRILPYLIASTTLRGAVVSFIDITAFLDAARLQAVIDALPEHIAVVDATGVITLVNAAWRRFAQANGDPTLQRSGPGVNYLSSCVTDGLQDADVAANAARGLRRVLEGSALGFSLEYPCHSPSEERWFVMHVAPVRHGNLGAVISHINVTAWRGGQS